MFIKGEVEPIGAVKADDETAALRDAQVLVEQRRHQLALDAHQLSADWIYLVPAEPNH